MLWACLAACDKQQACRATVTSETHTATAEGANRSEAHRNACSALCIAHDPLIDGKYRVWRAAGGKGTGERAKDIESVAVLKRYLDQCRDRCTAETGKVAYAECAP